MHTRHYTALHCTAAHPAHDARYPTLLLTGSIVRGVCALESSSLKIDHSSRGIIIHNNITVFILFIQPDGGSFAFGLGAPGVGNWAGMNTVYGIVQLRIHTTVVYSLTCEQLADTCQGFKVNAYVLHCPSEDSF